MTAWGCETFWGLGSCVWYNKGMTPIVFNDISRLSDEGLSVQERNAIADKVHSEHGVDGLVTLWRCQDYYEPTEPLNIGFTPATEWWLGEGNVYAGMVREALESLNEEDALALLKSAMFPPMVEMEMWAGMNNEHMKLYAPEGPDKYSHASATTVRQVAQLFFPQHPHFGNPQCSIYLETYDADEYDEHNEDRYPSHGEPLVAFQDDAAALQYLTRVHIGLTVQRKDVTPEMDMLLAETDGEWGMYDDMGLSPEEGYAISKSLVVPASNIALPAEFSH